MNVAELKRKADNGRGALDNLSNSITINERDIDFDKYINSIPEAEKIRPIESYRQELKDSFFCDDPDPGCLLPWQKTHSTAKLRKGELTIWAGVNSHGKSMLQGYVNLYLAAQGEKVCIASMEMKPRKTLERMVKQYSGVSDPTPRAIDNFTDWAIGKFWLYDQIGTVRTDRMLAVARYAIYELGITHFVIDSLMKCGISTDDYNKQKYFVDELSTLAKDTNTHIHLIAHSRKGETEHKIMDKFDIKGAGEITDMADNVFIIWKNMKKQEQVDSIEGVTVEQEKNQTAFCT